MASVTVSAISNNGSVKEYTTKFEKCPQAVSHQRMAHPKWEIVWEKKLHPNNFSTFIIIANIIFELETSTILAGIQ